MQPRMNYPLELGLWTIQAPFSISPRFFTAFQPIRLLSRHALVFGTHYSPRQANQSEAKPNPQTNQAPRWPELGRKLKLNQPEPRARGRRPPRRVGSEAPRCATPESVARRRHAAAARPKGDGDGDGPASAARQRVISARRRRPGRSSNRRDSDVYIGSSLPFD
jgi:hypothetical protein